MLLEGQLEAIISSYAYNTQLASNKLNLSMTVSIHHNQLYTLGLGAGGWYTGTSGGGGGGAAASILGKA